MTDLQLAIAILAVNAAELAILMLLAYRQGTHYSWLKELGRRLTNLEENNG